VKQVKRITWGDVKSGDTIVLMCDVNGVKGQELDIGRELRVAVMLRDGHPAQNVVAVFHGIMDQFVFHPTFRVKRIEESICSACQSPERAADLLCTAAVDKYVVCRTDDLIKGDRTCRIGELHPKPNSVCFVDEIQRCGRQFHDGMWVDELFQITLRICRVRKPDRTKTIFRLPHSQLRHSGSVPCGAVLCECCAQDPADGKNRWCPDHWSIRRMEFVA